MLSRDSRGRWSRDFCLYNGGSVVLLTPITGRAEEWAEANLPDDAPMMGGSVAIECRFVGPIIEGILNDGLTVKGIR